MELVLTFDECGILHLIIFTLKTSQCPKHLIRLQYKPELDSLIQLLKAFRIKFQKFAAHAHKDALINETLIPT